MKKEDFHEKIDELKEKVVALQKGVEDLQQTGIKENVLLNILKTSSQRFCKSSHPLTIGDVKAVIKGIETLKSYMFNK